MLDYMYRHLGQLAVVDDLPDIMVPSIPLSNRALDVKSAALIYLAVHIRHQGNRLGITGMSNALLETYLHFRQRWYGPFQRKLRMRLMPNSIRKSNPGVQFRTLQ